MELVAAVALAEPLSCGWRSSSAARALTAIELCLGHSGSSFVRRGPAAGFALVHDLPPFAGGQPDAIGPIALRPQFEVLPLLGLITGLLEDKVGGHGRGLGFTLHRDVELEEPARVGLGLDAARGRADLHPAQRLPGVIVHHKALDEHRVIAVEQGDVVGLHFTRLLQRVQQEFQDIGLAPVHHNRPGHRLMVRRGGQEGVLARFQRKRACARPC